MPTRTPKRKRRVGVKRKEQPKLRRRNTTTNIEKAKTTGRKSFEETQLEVSVRGKTSPEWRTSPQEGEGGTLPPDTQKQYPLMEGSYGIVPNPR